MYNGGYWKGLNRNIYMISDIQAAIKALDNFQINSIFVWDCISPWNWQILTRSSWYWCQGIWEQVEMNWLVSWPEKAPHIHSQNLSLHWVYLRRLPGGWSWTGQAGNLRSIGSPYVDKGKLRAFLKPICGKSWGVAQSEQKPAKNNDRVADRTLSFKRTFI